MGGRLLQTCELQVLRAGLGTEWEEDKGRSQRRAVRKGFWSVLVTQEGDSELHLEVMAAPLWRRQWRGTGDPAQQDHCGVRCGRSVCTEREEGSPGWHPGPAA